MRQLLRQLDSQFYERTALSRNKVAMLEKGGQRRPEDAVTAEEEVKSENDVAFLSPLGGSPCPSWSTSADARADAPVNAARGLGRMPTMMLQAMGALVSTVGRRLRHGPLRPSWSLLFETSICLLRRTSQRAVSLDPLGERALWSTMKAPPAKVFGSVTQRDDALGGVPVRWFEPRALRSDATIVYVHGGSFIYGSFASHGELIAHLAVTSGARVLALDYRLAPEHRYPAALDDVLAAYAALLESGTAPSKVVLAGDSAGGNLVLATLLRLRDEGRPMPAGVIALSPWVDLARKGGTLEANQAIDWGVPSVFARWARTYLPAGPLDDPRVSPMYGDFSATSPLLVLYGECEMLRDQVEELVERVRAAGLPIEAERYPDMVHGWMTLASVTPEAARAFERCARFVAERTNASVAA